MSGTHPKASRLATWAPGAAALALALALGALGPACGSAADRPSPAGDTKAEASTDAGAGVDVVESPVALGSLVSGAPFSNYEAETQVAVSPSGGIFVVWIALSLGGGRSVGYALSTDSGSTWSAPAVVPATPGNQAVDPSVAVDAKGIFHVSWLEVTTTAARRVMTASYIPDGDVFTIPVEVSDPAGAGVWDKPALVAQDDGSLLVVYGTDGGSAITVARSADGQTWTRSTLAPDGTLRNIASACASGAHAYVVSLIPNGVELVRSADSGATWSAPIRVDVPGSGAAFEPPSCAASGTDAWVVYGTGGGGGSEAETPLLDAVWVAHSADSGASVASRVRLAERAPSASHFLLPVIAREPGGGRLAVAYYTGPRDGAAGSFRVTFSDDGSAWTPSVALESPVLLTTKRDSFGWLGDYVGLAVRGGTATLSFASNASVPGQLLSRVRVARMPVR